MKRLKIILCIAVIFTLTVSAFAADASASWYDDISGGSYSPIIGEPYVADTFHGVKALYSLVPGSYQCAELIPRFYKEAYGLDTFIFASYGSAFGMDPIEMTSSGYKFVTPETPSPGDIIYTTSAMRNGNGDHWAIVKSFDGSTITLFEQNVKYNGKAGINRKLKYPSDYYYIYSPRKISDNSKPALGGGASNVVETTTLPETLPATTAAPVTTVVTTTEKTTQPATTAPVTAVRTTAEHTTVICTTAAPTKAATTGKAETTVLLIEKETVAEDVLLAEAITEESTTAPEEYSAYAAMLYAETVTQPEMTEAVKPASSRNYKPVIAAAAALAAVITFVSVLIITKKSRG